MRTYGSLALAGDRWLMDHLEPHVAIRMKQLFPRVPKHLRGGFSFPNDLSHAADLSWFLSRYPLSISDADRQALEGGRLGFEDRAAEIERILLPSYTPPRFAGLRDGQNLRPYQAQAVEVLARSGGLMLADEVGLGKTYVTAGACLLPDALPAVVVCLPHLQRQWATVISAFTNLRSHMIKRTRPYDLPPADIYIFRYTQLLGWIDVFRKLGVGLAAFDEIQELRRGDDSAKGRAAGALADEAKLRLGLSATPIYNYGTEAHAIMRFISKDTLGDFGDFVREWCGWGRILQDPQAFGTYLREQHVFLRRLKRDVGQDMPAVNRIVDVIDYDQEQVASIEALARALAIKATTGDFVSRGQAARELDMLARLNTGVAKAAQVADFVRILVESGEPVVLVGWHRDVYDIWLDKLSDLRPAMYTGSETAAQKAKEAERFVAGDTHVMIMSLRSGAGLDGLQQRCSTIVFGELDWSPGVHHQCIGRLDREGQTEPVTAIFLVVEEGSDPPIMEVLGLKASQASAIVDPHLGVQKTHSDASHLQMLVKRYLSKRAAAALPSHEVLGPPAEIEPAATSQDALFTDDQLAGADA